MWRERFAIVAILVAILAGVLILITQTKPQQTENNESKLSTVQNAESTITNSNQNPTMKFDQKKEYRARVKTSEGEMVLVLNTGSMPITSGNFITLANKGFYNNTTFHRVIKDFMIQGGDPKGDGTGGPGYKFADEPFEGDYTRGTVAMANSGPNTNGSQFFIMHKDYQLPKQYVIFGKLIEGEDVLDKIASTETDPSNDRPVKPINVETIQIEEIPRE